jgi:hypothetical protein
MPQFRISARSLVHLIENLFKLEKVQKLDQSKKPSKRAKPFCTSAINGGSRDSSGSERPFPKTFTSVIFPDIIKSLFNHLGYLLSGGVTIAKPNHNRKPRWFSISYSELGAKLR